MTSEGFSPGDLVWAKVRNYASWPARIEASPPPYLKPSKNKRSYCVFFFGTEDYAFVPEKQITPHSESVLNKLKKNKKSAAFQKAVDDLLSFVVKNEPSNLKMKTKVPNEDFKPQGEKGVNVDVKKHARASAHKSTPKELKKSLSDSKGECSSVSSSKHHEHNYCSDAPAEISFHNSIENALEVPVSGTRYSLSKKRVKVSKKKIGFIGLGHMGKSMVKRMVEAGHDVTVWNRSAYKYHGLEGVKTAESPADLVLKCDIIFSCVSDSEASKAVVHGKRGVAKGFEMAEKLSELGKGYVEMSSIDPVTSLEISKIINSKRGLYLEAPLCGTSVNADEGTLVIIASGDKRVFLQCETCFIAIGKDAFYMTYEVGYSAKLVLLFNTLSGTLIAAVAEVMVLAEKLNVPRDILMLMLFAGPLNTDNILHEMQMMNDHKFPERSIRNMQEDVNHTLALSDEVSQPMPITAAANELYKEAMNLGYDDNDSGAIYKTLHPDF